MRQKPENCDKTITPQNTEKEISLMIDKKSRTMDLYETAGADMRLLKMIGTKALMDVSQVLSAADCDKFIRALHTIEKICSHAEDNMFRDHPGLSSQYTDVFYGSSSAEPRNEVDERMHERMKGIVDELIPRT